MEKAHQKVLRLRKEMGWTQEMLAAQARVDTRTVRRAERGEPLSSETRQQIAAALGVSCDYLLDAPAAEQAQAAPPQVQLTPVSDGHAFFGLLGAYHAVRVHADDAEDDGDADAVKTLLSEIETAEMWAELGSSDRYDAQQRVSTVLSTLRHLGWYVGGVSERKTLRLGDGSTLPDWRVVTLRVINAKRVLRENPGLADEWERELKVSVTDRTAKR